MNTKIDNEKEIVKAIETLLDQSGGWSVKATETLFIRAIELVRNTCQALKTAIDLLEEVEWSHRDNNNPDYNQCDGDPCEFCRVARTLMHSPVE
tara:strand:+ start:6181 stop:6462 length:282 start_codon:yes stop_codon:yes gene_type:complete